MTKKTETALESAVNALGIKAVSVLVRKPLEKLEHGNKTQDWQRTAFQWAVTLTRPEHNNQAVTLDYFTGCGCVKKPLTRLVQPIEPSAGDVLYSVLMDSSACEQSFDDWCQELGHDIDSRKALDTYLKCQTQFKDVRKLFKSNQEIQDLKDCEH